MKNLKLSLLALLITAGTAFAGNNDVSKYNVNKTTSQVEWLGKKVVGSHTGNINVKSGSFALHQGIVQSANITIDMKSITNTDMADAQYQAKLVGHLKSDDFFGVSKYPTANFKSSKFIKIPNAKSGQNNYMVYGELTIKGITQQIEFPALVVVKNDKVMAEGTMIFDRSKYNVKYGSTSFFDSLGDKAIMDDVELEFSIVAQRASVN